MTRTSLAILLLAFAPSLFANDTDHVVMKTVFDATAHTNHQHGVAPAVVREKTLGGANAFASHWIERIRGGVIGHDLAAAYARVNADQENVTDFFPKLVKTVAIDEPYDWTKVSGEFPRANSIMVFSRPAFDTLGSIAIVRADVIPKNGTATTTFYELEHQPDGTWKIGKMATATYAGARH